MVFYGNYLVRRQVEHQAMDILMDAIDSNDSGNFRKYFSSLRKGFFLGENNYICMLFEESIRNKRCQIFQFLLRSHGTDDVGTLGALDHVLNSQNSVPENYVLELLKKYSSVVDGETLLGKTAGKGYVHATKFLLDKGLDVNGQDKGNCTPLHMSLMANPDINSEELITTLLCHGADASVEAFNGYNSFELAVKYKHTDFVQEMLFEYIFDSRSKYKLHFSVLLQLAKLKSPLFHQLLTYEVEFFLDENIQTPFSENLNDLLLLETAYLKIILEKYDLICCGIVKNYLLHISISEPISRDFFSRKRPPALESILYTDHILTKLNLLLQSSAALNNCVTDFINSLDCYQVFYWCPEDKNEENVTKIFAYLLTTGLRVTTVLQDEIFRKYGYCELFKILLYLDPEPDVTGATFLSAMASYICDVNLTLDALPLSKYLADSVIELTNYFVHPKLRDFLSTRLLKKDLTRLENYPRVPKLVEMARNSFRQYFVTKLDIKSAKQYYTLLNCLPIGDTHKKIITLETKLYDIQN
ncbi:hypothetical protein Zmor_015546 [Zophobas morio]|uniref:Uncharacterized protein n=1 Tax=Zophobas morio TaxID=2755281 RepID=A0AA38IED0_9CUCU|nr:hypothetical protein Zmor_015546 [Zophobas morio]